VDAKGTWQDYTTTPGGATFSLVNARWCRVGDMVDFAITAVVESMTNTSVTFSLPASIHPRFDAQLCNASFRDTGVYSYSGVGMYYRASASVRLFYQVTGTNGRVSDLNQNGPFTWGPGDTIQVSGRYETDAA
jgi:hypothetical protein